MSMLSPAIRLGLPHSLQRGLGRAGQLLRTDRMLHRRMRQLGCQGHIRKHPPAQKPQHPWGATEEPRRAIKAQNLVLQAQGAPAASERWAHSVDGVR